MALNLYALTYVNEVAKTGSITKASQNLFLTQPYLSKMIKSLEKDLGVTLFRRTTKGVELTESGRTFVRHSQKLLAGLEMMESLFYEPEETFHVDVSMGRSEIGMQSIIRLINRYADRKRLMVRVNETSPFQVIEDVRTREADFGALPMFDIQEEYYMNQLKTCGLSHSLYYDRPIVLVMSKNNPLNRLEKIEAFMLRDQIQVLYGDYESPNVPYERLIDSSNLYMADRRVYVRDRSGIFDVVSGCENSFSWLANVNADYLERHSLVARRCEGVSVRFLSYFIYYHKDDLSPESLELMKVMRESEGD